MARIKTQTLTIDTDKTYTLTGAGQRVAVSNHLTPTVANNGTVYVNINAAATLAGDDMIPVLSGRPRIIPIGDHDGSVDIHVIGHVASDVSCELISEGEEEYLL